MARLDPELRYLLDKYQTSVADGITLPDADTPIRVMVHYTADAAPIIALGLQVDSYHDGMAAGAVYLRDLAAIAAHPKVERIVKMRSYYTTLNDSIPKIRANQVWSVNNGTFSGYTGKGVIVGIIDTGIDYRHKAFQAGGKSRILRIWDQSAKLATEPSTGKQAPTVPATIVNPKGVEYVQDKITAAIAASNPLSIVGQMDIDGHGTHVAGIAAGNGSQSGSCHGAYTYIGVAPEADLIIVKLDHLGKQLAGGTSSADDDDILNAMRYITHHASILIKRAAINMSLGGQYGSHDGKNSLDEKISSIQMANKNTIVTVIAASNEGDKDLHTQGTVPANNSLDIEVKVDVNKDAPKASEVIEIWFSRNDTLTCSVQPDGGAFTAPPVNQNQAVTFPGINNGGDVTIDSTSAISNSLDESFTLLFTPTAGKMNQTGTWKIKLTNAGATPVPFHAWIDSSGTTGTKFKSPDSSCTLGSPGTAQEAITVGSFGIDTFLGLFDGSLSSFSSRGPTRTHEYQKPDIIAPGENITAPAISSERTDVEDYLCFKCCCDCYADFYIDNEGTSMAAPHVTGAVALMLQKNPALNHVQVRNKFTDTAIKDGDTSSTIPNDNWGFGKLDVKAALDTIVLPSDAIVPVTPTPIVTMPHRQLVDLQERFLQSTRGTEWRGVVGAFAQEVNKLVNSNKRVATVWHRNGGPAWVRVAFQMAATPTMPLPETANGHSIQAGISNMLDILKRYGSAPLVQWLTQNEPDLALIQPGQSLFQLLNNLNEPIQAV